MQFRWLCAVIAVAILVNINTLGFEFVWDDVYHIKENPIMHSLKNMPTLLTSDDGEGTDDENPYYRPVTNISFALDYAVWQDNPAGFHLTNLIIHLCVIALVWIFTMQITGSLIAAVAGGMVFAVHPAQAEAVAYISARADMLAAVWIMVALLAYTRFSETGKRRFLFFSLLAFFISLHAKIVTLLFPCLILVHCLFRKKGRRHALYVFFLYLAVAALHFILRGLILEKHSWDTNPFTWHLFTSPGLIVEYLRLMVFPVTLKVFYHLPIQKFFWTKDVIGPLVTIAAVCCTLIYIFRRHRDKVVVFCLLWIALMLFPASGIPALIYPALMAERYLYIPLIGFSILAGYGISALFCRVPGRVGRSLCAISIAGILAGAAVHRYTYNFSWSSPDILWTRALQDAPRSRYVLNRLAVLSIKANDFKRAEKLLLTMLSLRPGPAVYNNLGHVYMGLEDFERAEECFEASLKMSPTEMAYKNLGLVHALQGEVYPALEAYRKALELDSDDEESIENLRMLYEMQRKLPSAKPGMR